MMKNGVLYILFAVLITFALFTLPYRKILDKAKFCPKCNQENDKFIPSSDILLFQKGKLNLSDDENLIHHIRHQILGPSQTKLKTAEKERHFSQAGQSQLVDEILHQRKGGFFVDCGAFTGKDLSNSLFFERYRNWTGILIEANPTIFKRLVANNRKAYQLNACLSTTVKPQEMQFSPAGVLGGITSFIGGMHKNKVEKRVSDSQKIHVQCFSLYHVLKALNQYHIDYFSLDVEGAELQILETIPWDKVKIDILTVEYNFNTTMLKEYRALMNSTGLYTEVGLLTIGKGIKSVTANGKALDIAFARKDIL